MPHVDKEKAPARYPEDTPAEGGFCYAVVGTVDQ